MTPIRSPADIIRAVGDKLSALKQDLRWDEALSNCVHVCVLCPSKNDEEDTVYGQLPSYERQYRQVLGEIGVGSFSWRTLRLSEQHLWRATLQAEYEVQAARFKGERGSGAGGNQLVLFNLCDSDESDGYPGTSVVRMLDAGAAALPPAATKTAAAAPVSSKSAATASFTGADLPFFLVSTDKFLMKQRFAQAGVTTAPYERLPAQLSAERCSALFDRLGSPLIVKPVVSAGSYGITSTSVVATPQQLTAHVASLLTAGHRGFTYQPGGFYVERYVRGREFTALVVGSARRPNALRVYPPIERAFDDCVPPAQRFCYYELYYESKLVGEAGALQDAPAPCVSYVVVKDPDLLPAIVEAAKAAYIAAGGCGYGRVDMRLDEDHDCPSSGPAATGGGGEEGAAVAAAGSGSSPAAALARQQRLPPPPPRLVVLEVNANCGVSNDGETSVGLVLRETGLRFADVITDILCEALLEARSRWPQQEQEQEGEGAAQAAEQ